MPRQLCHISPELESEILKLIGEGYSYNEMCRTLNIKAHMIIKIKRKNNMLPPLEPKRPAWWN